MGYRNLIGELRYAQRLRSRAVARCRFYVAEARPWPEDPVPLDGDDHELDSQLAADAMENFARIPFDHQPDGFTSRLDENLGLVGEVWNHIDPDDIFHVRSVSEIVTGGDGRVSIAGLPGGGANTMRPLDAQREDLLRLWVPDAEWGQLADAPMRALLDVAEDVVLAGREQRAAARSRVAANGVLLMPDSLSMVRTRDTTDEDNGLLDDSVMSDTFMADFTAAMLAPISDDGDPQGVVPIVLRGDREDIEKVKHLTLDRADPEQLIARQTAALTRLLRGLDVQPEQVEGIGSVNHWGGWQIDARAIRDQIQPAAETIAAAMMQAFMRPTLESVGHRDLSKVMIAVDTSPLSENPNRGQDARDAWDRFAISDESLRRELGFGDEDKPSNEEYVRRLASQGRLPVQEVAQVMGLAREDRESITVKGEVVESRALPAGEDDRPVARPGQITPERPIPTAPDPTIIAAALPDPTEGWSVNEAACRALSDIDAALAERVQVAAEAAVQRVVDRAGAKARSAAQKDRALAASLSGVDAALVPSTIGRERVEVFVPVQDLVTDSYDRLRAQVERWLVDAATQTADAVVAILGLPADSPRGEKVHGQVQARLALHRTEAWPLLAAELDTAAEWALFNPTPDDGLDGADGEAAVGVLDTGAIVDALAAAGGEIPGIVAAGKRSSYGGDRRRRHRRAPKRQLIGAPPVSGPATGPAVRGIIAENGGVPLGWTWDYRPELARGSTFDPHKQLAGQRFTSWRDPILATTPATAWVGTHFRPQDHSGCRCTATLAVGVVEDPESVMAQAIRDAHGNPDAVIVGGIPGQGGATDLRDRARAAVDAMREDYINRPRRKR